MPSLFPKFKLIDEQHLAKRVFGFHSMMLALVMSCAEAGAAVVYLQR